MSVSHAQVSMLRNLGRPFIDIAAALGCTADTIIFYTYGMRYNNYKDIKLKDIKLKYDVGLQRLKV